jgi:WD40 repeat protein
LVNSVAFSSDGMEIVSGGDNALRFWDGKSGQPIGPPLQGHKSDVRSVAFSHDGTLIASGSNDATLRLWPGPKAWVDLSCAKLTRNMSRREWREWISPDLQYRAQCPGLPVPPDLLASTKS